MTKKVYQSPKITTESIKEADAQGMGGGGGGGKTCNGSSAGGRKDRPASGCSTLLT